MVTGKTCTPLTEIPKFTSRFPNQKHPWPRVCPYQVIPAGFIDKRQLTVLLKHTLLPTRKHSGQSSD